MNRNKLAAGWAALTLLSAAAAVPATKALAQFGGGRGGARPEILAWSSADSRPHLRPDRSTGIFIWHDRNTVHVQSTDNRWFGADIRGFIEIRGGKFDNIQYEQGGADTRFRQIGKNRIEFHFSSQDSQMDGFKFNLHGGKRILFHVGLDQHPTGRLFYGQYKTPAGEDPVVFDLGK